MWSYVRDERPWCGQAPPCTWYQFSENRKGEHPAPSPGIHVVHADGYNGFNGIFGDNLATQQAFIAYVQRKFVDVFERDGSEIAKATTLYDSGATGEGLSPCRSLLSLHLQRILNGKYLWALSHNERRSDITVNEEMAD